MMKAFAIVAMAPAALGTLTATSPFLKVKGNACGVGYGGHGPSPCGCNKGGCSDKPGFKFKGTLATVAACEATCAAAPAVCDIWLYSTGSHHCWWRTDGIWEIRGATTGVVSGCRDDGPNCVAGCGACAKPKPAPAPAPALKPFVPKWTTTEPNMNGNYPLSPTPGAGNMEKFPKVSCPANAKFLRGAQTNAPPVQSELASRSIVSVASWCVARR